MYFGIHGSKQSALLFYILLFELNLASHFLSYWHEIFTQATLIFYKKMPDLGRNPPCGIKAKSYWLGV